MAMKMKSNETRQAYIQRINFVLDFIEKNLETDLTLEQLSQKAHYSAYHFHRVFSLIVGENLNQYISRKRIERIASILLVDQKIVLKDIIYKYGFNSDNSFSRAFKKYYGISPTAFKTEGKKLLSKIGIEAFPFEKYICVIDNNKQWLEMNAHIKVKELAAVKLAGIMHIGDFSEMGKMYQRVMAWGLENEVLSDTNFKAITIYHDNPRITQDSKLRFSACVTVDRKIKGEGEIRALKIEKGIYAVGQFEIEAKEIPKAWESLCMWVMDSGYAFRDSDYFEVYHNDHKTHPEQKFILDICIPLVPNKTMTLDKNLRECKQQSNSLDYHELINYMKKLRHFFQKEYESHFKLGTVYQNNPDYSYFSLTTSELKKQKLKFVIILNHHSLCFSICLSGQNKSIRRKYWEIFKESSWKKYPLAVSIDESLSIVDCKMVEKADFNNSAILTEQIEIAALEFINEITAVLE